MSNQSVIIKSNRYGLIVILDEKPDWETIKKEVAEKFSASRQIFWKRPDGPVLSGKNFKHGGGTVTGGCHRKELPDSGGLPGG